MQKSLNIYLGWIQEAIDKIRKYTTNISKEEFESNTMIQDACIMQIQHIGETIIQIDKNFGDAIFINEKSEIIGFRHIASHQYKTIRVSLLRNVIQNKIDILEENINKK